MFNSRKSEAYLISPTRFRHEKVWNYILKFLLKEVLQRELSAVMLKFSAYKREVEKLNNQKPSVTNPGNGHIVVEEGTDASTNTEDFMKEKLNGMLLKFKIPNTPILKTNAVQSRFVQSRKHTNCCLNRTP